MRAYPEVLREFDRLWAKAQRRAADLLDSATQLDPDKKDELKDLNTAVTILKRIQDACRAIHLDAAKIKEQTLDAESAPEEEFDGFDNEKLDRILQKVEEQGFDAYEPEEIDKRTL